MENAAPAIHLKTNRGLLKFILLKESEKEIEYAYYPEGKKTFGFISYDIKTGNCRIVSLSPDDEHKIYAFKMMRRIRKSARLGSFEAEGIVAWY